MKARLRNCSLRICVSAALFFAGDAASQSGFWIKNGNGSWATAANWLDDEIADGTDETAFFGSLVNIPANTTVTLDGARVIGDLVFTDQGGADNWILNTGTAGPLTLDNTFDTPSITVALAAQLVTINAVLAGTNGLEKLGAGTLLLTATNTFSGEAIVSAGTLRVDGRVGVDGVTVAGGSLGGTGLISGPVTVQAGAVLTPGNSNAIGTLSISNTLTLLAGCTTRVDVDAASLSLARDVVQGLTSVSFGGTLVVSNLAGTPTLGQSFAIFSAASASGNFTNITPPPGAWLRWKFVPASGVLSVVSSASQPRIAHVALSGANLMLQATNGPPGGTNFVLTSTNVALAVTNWTRLATNRFDVSGNLFFTNATSPATPQRFYLISVLAGP